MHTHKYSQSLRGFGPVCACSPTLASVQNTHVTDLCVCAYVLSVDFMFLNGNHVKWIWIWLHGCVCVDFGAITQKTVVDIHICCDVQRCWGKTGDTAVRGGLGVCACISKHFCSFLHCMHIWKLVHLIACGTYSAWQSAICFLLQSTPKYETKFYWLFKCNGLIPDNDSEQSISASWQSNQNLPSSVFIWNFKIQVFPDISKKTKK